MASSPWNSFSQARAKASSERVNRYSSTARWASSMLCTSLPAVAAVSTSPASTAASRILAASSTMLPANGSSWLVIRSTRLATRARAGSSAAV